MNTQKKAAQKLWAENKYLVLSKSQKIYKEIREYLKTDTANPDKLKLLIDKALKLDEDKSEMINALQHIWGYFKNNAGEDEKTYFLYLMSRYKENKIDKNEVLSYLSTLLKKYPNKYLEDSTIFNQQPRRKASGYVVLIRWLQSDLIPFVTTQSVADKRQVLNPPHE